MTTLDRLITHLADAVDPDIPAAGVLGVTVTDVDLVVPLETMSDGRELMLVGIPRGLLQTGFERPLGELRMRFSWELR